MSLAQLLRLGPNGARQEVPNAAETQQSSSADEVPVSAGSLPPWCAMGSRLHWWSESQKKVFPVRVTQIDEQQGMVIATFEDNAQVWKSVPFKMVGKSECPLRQIGEATAPQARKRSRSRTPDAMDLVKKAAIEEVIVRQRQEREHVETVKILQAREMDERRQRAVREIEQRKVQEAYEQQRKQQEDVKLKAEEDWRAGLRAQREKEAALEAAMKGANPEKDDDDQDRNEDPPEIREAKRKIREEKRAKKDARDKERKQKAAEDDAERKKREAEETKERQINDAKMLIRQRAAAKAATVQSSSPSGLVLGRRPPVVLGQPPPQGSQTMLGQPPRPQMPQQVLGQPAQNAWGSQGNSAGPPQQQQNLLSAAQRQMAQMMGIQGASQQATGQLGQRQEGRQPWSASGGGVPAGVSAKASAAKAPPHAQGSWAGQQAAANRGFAHPGHMVPPSVGSGGPAMAARHANWAGNAPQPRPSGIHVPAPRPKAGATSESLHLMAKKALALRAINDWEKRMVDDGPMAPAPWEVVPPSNTSSSSGVIGNLLGYANQQ